MLMEKSDLVLSVDWLYRGSKCTLRTWPIFFALCFLDFS